LSLVRCGHGFQPRTSSSHLPVWPRGCRQPVPGRRRCAAFPRSAQPIPRSFLRKQGPIALRRTRTGFRNTASRSSSRGFVAQPAVKPTSMGSCFRRSERGCLGQAFFGVQPPGPVAALAEPARAAAPHRFPGGGRGPGLRGRASRKRTSAVAHSIPGSQPIPLDPRLRDASARETVGRLRLFRCGHSTSNALLAPSGVAPATGVSNGAHGRPPAFPRGCEDPGFGDRSNPRRILGNSIEAAPSMSWRLHCEEPKNFYDSNNKSRTGTNGSKPPFPGDELDPCRRDDLLSVPVEATVVAHPDELKAILRYLPD